MVKLVPHEVILVTSIPECNFCDDGTPGPYDFATVMGPWANGCEEHYQQYRATGSLGTGKGQLLVTQDQVKNEPMETDDDGHIIIDGPSGKQTLDWYADSGNFDGDLVDLL